MHKSTESGDIKDTPEHWCQVLNLEPTKGNLEDLSVLLRQKPVSQQPPRSMSRGLFNIAQTPFHPLPPPSGVCPCTWQVSWVNEFIELRGVIALSDLLELFEKKVRRRNSCLPSPDRRRRCPHAPALVRPLPAPAHAPPLTSRLSRSRPTSS